MAQISAEHEKLFKAFIDKSPYKYDDFSESQKLVIISGLEDGFDPNVFAKPEFDPSKIYAITRGLRLEIKLGLEKGSLVSNYLNQKFDSHQMHLIVDGLIKGFDVSIYAKPEFDFRQMHEILIGMKQASKNGLDPVQAVSIYANPYFDYTQMGQVRTGLLHGIDASLYANPDLEWHQMREIRLGIEQGLNVTPYANPAIDWQIMRETRLAFEQDFDITSYIKVHTEWQDLRDLRLQYEKNPKPYPKYDSHKWEQWKGLKDELLTYEDELYEKSAEIDGQLTLADFDIADCLY